MHFHSYSLTKRRDLNFYLSLERRLSTDANGIAVCMGLQAQAKGELEIIIESLEKKYQKKHNSTFFSVKRKSQLSVRRYSPNFSTIYY